MLRRLLTERTGLMAGQGGHDYTQLGEIILLIFYSAKVTQLWFSAIALTLCFWPRVYRRINPNARRKGVLWHICCDLIFTMQCVTRQEGLVLKDLETCPILNSPICRFGFRQTCTLMENLLWKWHRLLKCHIFKFILLTYRKCVCCVWKLWWWQVFTSNKER